MENYDFNNPYPKFPYDEKLASLMQENGTKESYPPATTVISPDSAPSLFYIKKGRVRVIITNVDGKEQIVAIIGENALVGAPAMMSKENVNYSIVTETPSVMYKLTDLDYQRLYQSSDFFKEVIVNNITENYFRLMHQMESQTFKSCKERLHQLLLISIDEESRSEDNWYRLARRYPQNTLAKIIGANRFTVTRLIHELSEEGTIRVINNSIEVKVSTPE